MFFVISYDISDDPRRTRVSNTLADFGKRVQFSVFECELKPEQLQTLQKRLQRIVLPSKGDDVRFYSLCSECVPKMRRTGGGRKPVKKGFYLI